MPNNKLHFTTQNARVRPLKTASSKFLESDVRPNIEVSDGIRPALPLIPFKYLPVKFQDVTTEQWVVIPKGRIVSAIIRRRGDDHLRLPPHHALAGGPSLPRRQAMDAA